VPLHTEFHAIVDGTSGDTYLQPVKASFLHSSFTASGSVVRLNAGNGHDIELNVSLDRARIEQTLHETHMDDEMKAMGMWDEWANGKRGRAK